MGIRDDLEKTLKMSLSKIIKNQIIIQEQMNETDLGYGKCKINEKGLARLQYWDYLYQAARDIKEFDGTIDSWVKFLIKKGFDKQPERKTYEN